MENTKFKFSEETYQGFLTAIQTETRIKLTEYEAGLCRAILDVRAENKSAGACLGSHFKQETKRLIKEKLIHADTFKYTGVCVPIGILSNIIQRFIKENERR